MSDNKIKATINNNRLITKIFLRALVATLEQGSED